MVAPRPGLWSGLVAAPAAAATTAAAAESASAAAATAASTATAKPASAAAAASGALSARSRLIDSQCPAANFFAVSGFNGSIHVLFGHINKPEPLVLNDPDLLDRAEWLEEVPQIIFSGAVGQIPYIQ
jgi:hypothetical protein